MAYITQYQADMADDQRNRQTQTAFGNALNGVVNTFQQNRQRALNAQRAQDAQDLAFAKDGVDSNSIDAYNKGDKSGIAKFYAGLNEAKRDQAARDKLLSNRVAESTILANESKLNEAGKSFAESKEGEAFRAKAAHEMAMKEKELLAKANEKTAKTSGEAFEVPGYGHVRTKAEAERIRTAKGDAETAKQYIEQIKELGKDVAIWDRDRVGKINQLKQALVGKLRLPLMGPGTMTEDEFQRTVSNLGDPSAIFGKESNEIGKLDQMSGILDNNIKAMYGAAASSNQPGMYQVQRPAPQKQVDPVIQQKIQQYTPEQKAQRLQQLKAKQAGVAMVGQ